MDPVTQVYKYLDTKNREDAQFPRPSRGKFRPSEVHQCSREIWYRHNDKPKKVVPGFVSLYGMDGDLAHKSTHWLLYRAGVDIRGIEFNEETGEAKEKDFFKKTIVHNGETLVISGRGDGRVFYYGHEHLLEIKSVDGFKYKHMLAAYQRGELIKYLKEGNKGKYFKFFQQSMLTAYCLGLDSIYLLMKDRSLCQLGMHNEVSDLREGGAVIPFDEEILTNTLDKLARIEKAKREGIAPDREFTEGSYECDRLCAFGHICRKEP